MRAPNEVDFWRGLALVSIFINHIPGFTFERATFRNYGLSDSAELFVFLAGWGLRRLADGSGEGVGLLRLVLRVGARGLQLYAVQILITMLAVALISGASLWLENPLLLEWNNAAAIFQDPVPAHIGVVVLTHQLGYFDILPLYVVLMLGAPLLALVHRLAPGAVLPLSFGLWAVALSFQLNLPTWPVEGVWYFNPFAWQLIFVLGFAVSADDGIGRSARRLLPVLRPLGWVGLIGGAWLTLTNFAPDPMLVPDPKLFFIVDKTYLSPLRLLHFLALVAVFAGSYRWVARLLPPLGSFLAMLGRNSLYVFCVGSLASLSGQIARFASEGSVAVDIAVLMVSIGAMGFTAWVSELRDRLRQPGARPFSAAA